MKTGVTFTFNGRHNSVFPFVRFYETWAPIWPIEIKGPSAGKLLAIDTKSFRLWDDDSFQASLQNCEKKNISFVISVKNNSASTERVFLK
jgi:hypothetical protein